MMMIKHDEKHHTIFHVLSTVQRSNLRAVCAVMTTALGIGLAGTIFSQVATDVAKPSLK